MQNPVDYIPDDLNVWSFDTLRPDGVARVWVLNVLRQRSFKGMSGTAHLLNQQSSGHGPFSGLLPVSIRATRTNLQSRQTESVGHHAQSDRLLLRAQVLILCGCAAHA